MPTINLLPWREKLHEARKKAFLMTWGGCLVAAVLLMVLVHGSISYEISKQKSVNAMIQAEISKLDVQIATVNQIKEKRDSLLSRMAVIKQLQYSRPLTVKVLDTMTRNIPEGVYLSNFSRKEGKITIEGMAESNSRVSELMRALASASYFSDPLLNEIKTDKSEKVYKSAFELQCMQIMI